MSMIIQSQLLATKFFIPTVSGTLISRPRLSSLLAESLKRPVTLISAPAGFGKTMVLSSWAQSLSTSRALVAWVSLDEEDNEPRLFWTYVLSALDQQQPELFTPLLKYLLSSEAPPLIYVLMALINRVLDSQEHLVLILDDYHLITEQQVHTTLSYLIEHLPPQLHIVLATRIDPPLPLSQLRAHQQVLEVRTDQLRCTAEEVKAFFREVMGIQMPEEIIQQVTLRTEGWLVGLQLLGLSLPERADPLTLLQEISGDQCYILDYLTQEVLGRQSQEVQTFLLSTSILQQLSVSLCNAVMQQSGSQHMLESLEHANLFVVSLDSKRQWYRYHALFAEALQHQLEQTQADLVPILHYRASLWYAEHDQTTQAILHTLHAKQWSWAADLIEQKKFQVSPRTWGVSGYELVLLQEWLELLPEDIVNARPLLCLACALLLWTVAPHNRLEVWLDAAEAALSNSLGRQVNKENSPPLLARQEQQKQEDQLGAVIAFRACLRGFCKEDGQAVLALCQRALALLSPQNHIGHFFVNCAQCSSSYLTSINDAQASITSMYQGYLITKEAERHDYAIFAAGITATGMIGAGQLHEVVKLTQNAIYLGQMSRESMLPDVGWPMVLQAEILREWNQLDTALSMVQEAIPLCKQTTSKEIIPYTLCAYAILLRVCLSRREYDAAHAALQQFEHIGARANQSLYLYLSSLFTTIDQVRLWLACGERDHAARWAQELDLRERFG